MAFPQAKVIVKNRLQPLSKLKLLMMAAASSRPRWRNVSVALLRPFTRDGEIAVHYPCYGRTYVVHVRVADLESDWLSVHELAISRIYPIEERFAPDLVIDGGGNTGLFTLLASAAYPGAKVVICEPVPRNLAQIEKHLRNNRVTAEVQPVCIGGSQRTIPFYVREANQGSFDPGLPYTSQINVDVVTLAALLGGRDAKRIFIKLDIEGMEVEALGAFVPGETRPVYVVGEVHSLPSNGPELKRIFEGNGWTVKFGPGSELNCDFTAWSPAAVSLLTTGEAAAIAP